MKLSAYGAVAGTALLLSVSSGAYADFQEIAPGTGLQSAIVVDSGADGICNTAASGDDIQTVPVGKAAPFQTEIKCGPDKIVQTTASGDDTQLIPVGGSCANQNTPVVDTGADGIADTTAAGDDVQTVPVLQGAPNTGCVLAGANGKADTGTAAGDDVIDLALGTAQATTPVIRCGPNKVAETTANNMGAGDDVQVVSVGSPCAGKNTVVVNSGPDGVSNTRAEGPDLVLKVLGPVHITIPKAKTTTAKKYVQRTVRVSVANVEFGASAPASRTYSFSVTDGSCPAGTVSNVDANASFKAPGLQTTASVPKGGTVTGSFVVTFHLEDFTSVATNIPFRCAVNVEADAVDTAAFNVPDDAVNTDNNIVSLDFEVIDKNDLP